MANASKAKIAANARYNSKTFDVLQCRVKKSENINQRIDDVVKAIQEATGNDKYSKAAFILDAIRAKLDNPQPVQAPQPDTTPATSPDNVLQVPLSPNMVSNMDGAIRCGYSSDRVQYAIRALNKQIQDDIAAEKEKRRARSVYPPFTIQHGHPGDAGYDPDDPGEYPDIDDDY